jgi:hypothetical protein
MESFDRAIFSTGTTFHAGVSIHNIHFPIGKAHDGMGAYQEAHSAPNAFFLMKF